MKNIVKNLKPILRKASRKDEQRVEENENKAKKAFIRSTEELSATFAYTLSPELVDSIIRSLAEKGCIKAILPEKDAKFGTYVCVSVC